MEGRKDHGPVDSRPRRALEVALEVRLRVPRPGQAVPDTGVTVTVDDHVSLPRQDPGQVWIWWWRFKAGTLLAALGAAPREVQRCRLRSRCPWLPRSAWRSRRP